MNEYVAKDSWMHVYFYLLCLGYLKVFEIEPILTKYYRHPYEIVTKVCSLTNFVEVHLCEIGCFTPLYRIQLPLWSWYLCFLTRHAIKTIIYEVLDR